MRARRRREQRTAVAVAVALLLVTMWTIATLTLATRRDRRFARIRMQPFPVRFYPLRSPDWFRLAVHADAGGYEVGAESVVRKAQARALPLSPWLSSPETDFSRGAGDLALLPFGRSSGRVRLVADTARHADETAYAQLLAMTSGSSEPVWAAASAMPWQGLAPALMVSDATDCCQPGEVAGGDMILFASRVAVSEGTAATAPEPATMTLFGSGLLAVATARRRRKKIEPPTG